VDEMRCLEMSWWERRLKIMCSSVITSAMDIGRSIWNEGMNMEYKDREEEINKAQRLDKCMACWKNDMKIETGVFLRLV
jgi:hypothetical protein